MFLHLWKAHTLFAPAEIPVALGLILSGKDRLAEETEAYTLWELKTGITFSNLPGKPGLNLKISNLFDTEYHTLGSYLPSVGRNIKLMAKVEF